MKKLTVLLVCILILMISGCDYVKKQFDRITLTDSLRVLNKKYDEEKIANEQMRQEMDLQMEYILSMTKKMNKMTEILNRINEQEKLVSKFVDEGEIIIGENETDPLEILSAIDQYFLEVEEVKRESDRQENEMSELLTKFSTMNKLVKSLKDTNKNLYTTIKEKEIEVQELKKEINNLVQKIDTLEESVAIQDEKIKDLKTKYFIIDTKKELKKKDLIEQKSFIGILGKVKITLDNYEHFTEISSDVDSLFLGSNKDTYEIISPQKQNPSSYKIIEKDYETYLKIYNTESFWLKNNYVVILKK